tara:strand:- start:16394 stop:17203 length:810 start_codon:yes stop_codon:yes gene_type:complete
MPAPDPVALSVNTPHGPLQLYVHDENDRVISRTLREQGVWEPYETTLVLTTLRAGGVFIDVGANLGYFSIVAASVVGPAGKVFAFEPDASNFALLQRNATHNNLQERIHAAQIALHDCAGEGRLYLSRDNSGDHQIHSSDERRDSVPVRLCHGSDYLEPLVSRIDLLKIDTQGAEYAVVKGLLPLLLGLPEKPSVLIELTPLSLRQAGSSGRQLIALLEQLQRPFWIVDHIEHRLVACAPQALAQWCDNVDAVDGDAGFMNILVGPGLP